MKSTSPEKATIDGSVGISPHPWPSGYVFQSPGSQFSYRVIGPCCRLFDREQLPWPCCRLQWRGKEPSWRRIGRRLIVDLATRRHPSYCVEILGHSGQPQPLVITLYTVTFSAAEQNWWHTKHPHSLETPLLPPSQSQR